jgi:catechol 2,3-dioxygenase-like lactoylglutathione lyase family enzyme
MSATDVKLSRVGTIMLSVREMERSLAFYRDTLGLPVKFASEGFAFLDGGGVTLALRRDPKLPDPGEGVRTEVVFEVADVQAAYDALRARGVAFQREPRVVTGDQHAADFRDPDGHVLSIFGPRTTG